MKIITLLLIILTSVGIAQTTEDYSKFLPGVVKVSDYLYYDKTEITNLQWQEYLSWIETNGGGKDVQAYLDAYPDTLVWRTTLAYNDPYVTYYFKHPAYQGYPVVGIGWMQAMEYCQWRTERVKEKLKADQKLDKAPRYFAYRLPTYDEYMLMYNDIAHLPNQIGDEGKRAFRGLVRYNMKRKGMDNMGVAGKLNDNADVTAPVESYWPNSFKVYNIKGNVAEWLMEKNTYVGGSWIEDMENDVTIKHTADSPESFVGFRCVCEATDEIP